MDEQQARKLAEQTKRSASTISESESRTVRRASEERLRQQESDYRRNHAPGPLPDNLVSGDK